jgi:hypothetical protein
MGGVFFTKNLVEARGDKSVHSPADRPGPGLGVDSGQALTYVQCLPNGFRCQLWKIVIASAAILNSPIGKTQIN